MAVTLWEGGALCWIGDHRIYHPPILTSPDGSLPEASQPACFCPTRPWRPTWSLDMKSSPPHPGNSAAIAALPAVHLRGGQDNNHETRTNNQIQSHSVRSLETNGMQPLMCECECLCVTKTHTHTVTAHSHILTRTRTHTHTVTHTHTHSHSQTHSHTHTHSYSHTHTHTFTNTYSHTFTHTKTHTHMEEVSHTSFLLSMFVWIFSCFTWNQ